MKPDSNGRRSRTRTAKHQSHQVVTPRKTIRRMGGAAVGQYWTRQRCIESNAMNAPVGMIDLVSQTGRCENLPLQTITPRNPGSLNLRSSATNYAVNGREFWSTVWYFKLRPIEFTLNSDCRCNVTLSLVMRTCLPYASAV